MPRTLDNIVEEVVSLAKRHCTTWQNKPEEYWMIRLIAEVGELAEAMEGKHPHSVEEELREIASICVNWMLRRANVAAKN